MNLTVCDLFTLSTISMIDEEMNERVLSLVKNSNNSSKNLMKSDNALVFIDTAEFEQNTFLMYSITYFSFNPLKYFLF